MNTFKKVLTGLLITGCAAAALQANATAVKNGSASSGQVTFSGVLTEGGDNNCRFSHSGMQLQVNCNGQQIRYSEQQMASGAIQQTLPSQKGSYGFNQLNGDAKKGLVTIYYY